MNLTRSLEGVFRIDFFDRVAIAGFSGRNYDNSKRGEFLAELGLDIRDLVMVKQVHGASVLVVDGADQNQGSEKIAADGLITGQKGVVLGIRTADCVPVFFHDPVKKVIGIAHGGWRGVREGILGRMIDLFSSRFRIVPKDLRVAVGPSIRACCYEVGVEMDGYFPGFYRPVSDDKGKLDLSGVIKAQLLKTGIQPSHLHDTGLCTACRNDAFYSHRVEQGTKERILNVISLVR